MSNDAGGMIREWLSELIKSLLEPTMNLFIKCDTHEISYRINENSDQIPKFVDYFYFLGMLIGKSLFDRIPLNLCLSKTIFKFLANETCTLEDIKFIDESVFLLREFV